MGTQSLSIERGLFGRTRSALLAILYGRSEQSFYVRQLARAAGCGHGAVQRELSHLTNLGLLSRTVRGNQVLYKANSQNPIFSEIKNLVAKTLGAHDVIRGALAPLGSQVRVAFIFGSLARGEERADSDVDLMVLGDAPFSAVVSALGPAQSFLGREINPTVFPVAEFRSKLAAGNHFLRAVMKEKKLFLLGAEDELAELAAKRLAGSARKHS